VKLWQSDSELFQLARRELFTAVVGDVMDKEEIHFNLFAEDWHKRQARVEE
jgi:hypothetical protein